MASEGVSEKLQAVFKRLNSRGKLSENDVKEAMREIKLALLEADVNFMVVKDFVKTVTDRAVGTEVLQSLTPGQQVVKIVNEELTRLMGGEHAKLEFGNQKPAVILMAGLQGAGKTTTAAKLARFLQERQKKKVAMVSADVYRPAAIKQLQTVAGEVGAIFFDSNANENPVDIANRAIEQAKIQFADVLIVDTAGRLHVDDEMMDEIKELHAAIKPTETLFVVDAMTGQDAANTAKAFNDALSLTGVILTKTDGDARGGAALSVRAITGKPIKFLGMGEKLDALEPFHPERIAQRILGMGDVLSLVEEVERKIDKEKAEKMAKKLQKGGSFNFEDMLMQFEQMNKMGGMMGFLDKLPGMSNAGIQDAIAQANPEKQVKKMEAIIQSMTIKERRNPDLMNPSRKKRIAAGCGMDVVEVNKLIKQHAQMAKMMKKFANPSGMAKMMKSLSGMQKQFGGGGGMGPLFGGNDKK